MFPHQLHFLQQLRVILRSHILSHERIKGAFSRNLAHGVVVFSLVAAGACLNGFLIPVRIQSCDAFRHTNEMAQCQKLALSRTENGFMCFGDIAQFQKVTPRVCHREAFGVFVSLLVIVVLLCPFVRRRQELSVLPQYLAESIIIRQFNK